MSPRRKHQRRDSEPRPGALVFSNVLDPALSSPTTPEQREEFFADLGRPTDDDLDEQRMGSDFQ